jgi:hypothetical protein
LHTLNEVIEKEKKYNISFPPSYKEYLLKYSNITVGRYELFRLNAPKWPYIDLDAQIKIARSIGLPEKYFPFLQDNSDFFCFDTSSAGPEFQIIFWSHDGLLKPESWANFMDWVSNCWIKEKLEE